LAFACLGRRVISVGLIFAFVLLVAAETSAFCEHYLMGSIGLSYRHVVGGFRLGIALRYCLGVRTGVRIAIDRRDRFKLSNLLYWWAVLGLNQ
jgi:hypothetical protein